jgi:23S rRNA (adenine1618-N6)-methyltransferase
LHPKNIHYEAYDFEALVKANPELKQFVALNEYNTLSIDFANSEAVLQLNKALLIHYYKLSDWCIPENYLCPPIPGRADYIHHLADLIKDETVSTPISGLDIGVGANAIYCILGAQIYNWKMRGVDIDEIAVNSARQNVLLNPQLIDKIEIRHQKIPANIFETAIQPNEYYHFTICNPPFHASKEEAIKGSNKKWENLKKKSPKLLNFGGQPNELWCNGGEALFIKRMIKQSVLFKSQVGWFTTLVSKKENLPKIYKQLHKLDATYKTIEMDQGNKKSRFLAWKF